MEAIPALDEYGDPIEDFSYWILWQLDNDAGMIELPLEDSTQNPLTVTMDGNMIVKAVFEEAIKIVVMQGTRQILESGGDADADGIPDDIATITATPQMPQLTARITGCNGCTVQWKFKLEYSRDGVPNSNGIFDSYIYPRDADDNEIWSSPISGAQVWQVVYDRGFVGGNAFVAALVNGEEYEFEFKVLGLNPTDGTVENFIDTNAGGHWYAKYIAKHESISGGEYYSQFNPSNTSNRYEPNKAPDQEDGFGIMMVDPPANRAQLWHWQFNVEEGIRRLDTIYRPEAEAWIASQIIQQMDEAPTQTIDNETLTFSGVVFQQETARTMTDACTIQRFNGALLWVIYWDNPNDVWGKRTSEYLEKVCSEI